MFSTSFDAVRHDIAIVRSPCVAVQCAVSGMGRSVPQAAAARAFMAAARVGEALPIGVREAPMKKARRDGQALISGCGGRI